MADNKGQEVPVEVAQIVLYWTCPNCNQDNHEDSKRNGEVAKLECVECNTVISKQGEVRWVVE